MPFLIMCFVLQNMVQNESHDEALDFANRQFEEKRKKATDCLIEGVC